jgi:putative phosphoribosyl transferase
MAASLPIPDHLGIGVAYPSGCGFPVARPWIATDGRRGPDKQHPVEMTVLRNGYLFDDRRDAGRALAARLRELDLDAPVIVALPRGGVPVGHEVAQQLGAPLDVGLVRKLGAPQQPELGIGAIGEDGTVVIDPGAVRALGVTPADLEAALERERAELARRRRLYREARPLVDVTGRDVVRVDDGMATGVTAVAAARVLHARGAGRVVVAVPVSPARVGETLVSNFDGFVALAEPERFGSVGAWYRDFAQTSDDEVVELLSAARRDIDEREPAPAARHVVDPERSIATGEGRRLPGSLLLPVPARGLVVFVHGSGSSRHSSRNVFVAHQLASMGFATLLFDLLTEQEAAESSNVFDVDLLTDRLIQATDWAANEPELSGLPVGYFGASTGAAAALRAAASLGDRIGAVVSRGGRPDLAGDALMQVTTPTLLIVGGNDWNVLELNDEACTLLGGPHELALVPGAGHLFEEPGALEQVARLAGGWFLRHLAAAREPYATGL